MLNFVNNEHLIFGDFNYDLKKEENDFWREINEFRGYKQLINDTTRLTSTSATLIDHIFTKKTENISDSGVIQDIPLSDHFMTFVGRKINYKTKFFPSSVRTIEYHSWNELNNEKLAKDFESAKFSTLYSNDCYDSNNFCIRFTSIIKKTLDKNIPIRKGG